MGSSAATGRSFAEIEQEFAGRGYGDFKKAVGESVVELLRPIREEATRLLADKAYLQKVCPLRRSHTRPHPWSKRSRA